MVRERLIRDSLNGIRFKLRVARGRLFQKLGGKGRVRKVLRLLTTPDSYLPYLFARTTAEKVLPNTRTPLFWGRAIHIPLQDYDALALRIFGFPGGSEEELRLTKFFVQSLTKDDVFYDVGANFGFYSYLSAEMVKEVHTFEPIPELVQLIHENTRGQNVTVQQVAVSNVVGTADLVIPASTGLSTIVPALLARDTPAVRTIRVPTTTLDTYGETHAAPTYMKIDAEGAESLIIEGGTRLFRDHSPTLSLEVWGVGHNGAVSMNAVHAIRNLGYESYQITSEGTLEKVAGDLSQIAPVTGSSNFIFKKALPCR